MWLDPRPFLRYRLSVYSVYLVARSARVIGAHFKACREYNAIDLVFLPSEYDSFACDLVHAFAVRVYKCDIWAVEGGKIFIMKTRRLQIVYNRVLRLQQYLCLQPPRQLLSAPAPFFDIG